LTCKGGTIAIRDKGLRRIRYQAGGREDDPAGFYRLVDEISHVQGKGLLRQRRETRDESCGKHGG
jgi:hypothetical protein